MKKLYHHMFTFALVTFLSFYGMTSFGQSTEPKVTVIQPNDAGIVWVKGTNNLISWEDNFVKPVDIYLIDDINGTASRTVTLIEDDVLGSTYNWNTNTAGVVAGRDKYKIRVQSSVDEIYQDLSDQYFSIVTALPGTYKVIQPNVAGIEWLHGTSHLISWEAGANENVKIELLANGSTVTITTGLPSSIFGTTYSWSIPTNFPAGDHYRIKITGLITGGSAVSDNEFKIIATPGGNIRVIQPSDANIEWKKGTTHLISWEDEIPEKVNIDLINGTASPTTVVANLATNVSGSTWPWNITQNVGTDYKIRISSTVDGSIKDESDNNFAIVSLLTGHFDEMFQPKDGDTWLLGTNHLISWEDELEETVDIYLLKYATATATTPDVETLLKSDVTGSTWSWNNVGPLGDYYKIEIRSHGNHPAVTPLRSEGFFKIVNSMGGAFNQFFQPLGGENWLRNTTYLISWEDDILEGVDIWITDETGAIGTFTKTATNVIGSTWLFNTGSKPYGDYRFKLTSTLNSGASLTSQEFHIVQSIGGGITAIHQPNEAGLVWIQETSNLISWEDDLTENVKIQLHYYGTDPGTETPTSTVIIPDATSVSGTTFNWNILSSQTPGYYRVEITSTLAGGPTKLAENKFRIMQLIDAQVYPNPCIDNVTVEFDESSTQTFDVVLFNRFGTRVIQRSHNSSDSKQLTLTTADLPNGVYFLNMTAGNNRISKKIIVQH